MISSCDTMSQENRILSHNDLPTTVNKLKTIIQKKGLTHFSTIDHQANAEGVGLDLLPESLVIFGNPKAGTTLMKCNPAIGLELPLRILIQTNDQDETIIHTSNLMSWQRKYNINQKRCLEILMKTQKTMDEIIRDITEDVFDT